jgi:Flp pilus assembly protein TadD
MSRSFLVLAALAVSVSGWFAWRWTRAQRSQADRAGALSSKPIEPPPVAAHYVGRTACAACHPNETKLWTGSHHDLAMQEATDATVLGDFSGAKYEYHGVVSTFTKKDGRFHVETDGADGALHDFEIAYTFGVEPLQQYLIAFPDGRLQALNVCWDTRPKDRGGQRWFHLYPNENVAHDDILHWTGPYQNWNYMCAECHSTDVHKNYDAAKDAFATRWSEIDVSCEACHGPASEHVAWAQASQRGESRSAESAATGSSPFASVWVAKGLISSLRERSPGKWVMDASTGIARRDRPRASEVELETCARCHARRSQLGEDWLPGKPLGDTHRPALLEPTLYEDDGQNKDEVYEYGAFLQSKMHAAGVTCTDCHDPHSLALPSDNSVCARCHAADRFDTPEHHHHEKGGKGSRCIECHMPSRDYMVVHTRHDHSFRVPRPDLSEKIGTPNACASCHADRPAAWAANAVAGWRQKPSDVAWHYGEALHLGNHDSPNAQAALMKLAADAKMPAIARASALVLLGEHLGPATGQALVASLSDRDWIVRLGAATALRDAPVEVRAGVLPPLLRDPVRAVRIEVGRELANAPASGLPADDRDAAERALAEWTAVQRFTGDRAEAHMNLGALAAESGDFDGAEREYRAALKLSPRFPGAYLNLADVFRQRRRDDEAERVLREGLKIAPKDANLLSALGLALVRLKRVAEALAPLEQAASASPDDPSHAYLYAIALSSSGQSERALAVLARAHAAHPGDRDVLQALATLSRDAKAITAAIEYAKELVALDPDDPNAQQLLAELTSSR